MSTVTTSASKFTYPVLTNLSDGINGLTLSKQFHFTGSYISNAAINISTTTNSIMLLHIHGQITKNITDSIHTWMINNTEYYFPANCSPIASTDNIDVVLTCSKSSCKVSIVPYKTEQKVQASGAKFTVNCVIDCYAIA